MVWWASKTGNTAPQIKGFSWGYNNMIYYQNKSEGPKGWSSPQELSVRGYGPWNFYIFLPIRFITNIQIDSIAQRDSGKPSLNWKKIGQQRAKFTTLLSDDNMDDTWK